jgi:hypothetical protein
MLFNGLFAAFLGHQLGLSVQLSSAFFYRGRESVLFHCDFQMEQMIRGFSLKILHSTGRSRKTKSCF